MQPLVADIEVTTSFCPYLQLVPLALLQVRVQKFLRDFLLELQHVIRLRLLLGTQCRCDNRIIGRCLVSQKLSFRRHRY